MINYVCLFHSNSAIQILADMKATKSQIEKMNLLKGSSELIESDVNENGFLNFTISSNRKSVPVKTYCIGRQGGIHAESWFESIEDNIPMGLIREWSRTSGLIFRKHK